MVLVAFADSLEAQVVRFGWLFDRAWRRAKANGRLAEIRTAALHVQRVESI